jgi:hypothetical protein
LIDDLPDGRQVETPADYRSFILLNINQKQIIVDRQAGRLKLRLITRVLFLVKFIYKRTKVRVPEANWASSS